MGCRDHRPILTARIRRARPLRRGPGRTVGVGAARDLVCGGRAVEALGAEQLLVGAGRAECAGIARYLRGARAVVVQRAGRLGGRPRGTHVRARCYGGGGGAVIAGRAQALRGGTGWTVHPVRAKQLGHKIWTVITPGTHGQRETGIRQQEHAAHGGW